MIERMDKVTLLVSEKDRERFVSGLRRAGVLHIKRIKEPVSHDIKFVEDRIARIERMIGSLEPYSGEREGIGGPDICDDERLLEEESRVTEEAAEKERLASDMAEIERQLFWFKEWGGFDPEELKALKEKGIDLRLFRIPGSKLGEIDEKLQTRVIRTTKQYSLMAVMADGQETVPGDEEEPPARSPEALLRLKQAKEDRVKEIDRDLAIKADWLEKIKKCKNSLEKEKEFQQVKHGMEGQGRFAYLQGYCPERSFGKVKELAEKENAGYMREEADDTQDVPTLVTNPKWIEIIKPVFSFMNTVPGYGEFDISGVFLVFFSLFFAMLVGDAGYGLIFVLVTFLARKKAPKAPPQPFFLMYLMGASTVIWGAITGTWFGSETIAQLPGFRALVVSKISSFGDTQDFLIYFCFVIGAIQLTIAHVMKFVREMNSPRAVAQIGWIAIVWGMFFAAGTLVVKKPFPPAGGWLLAAGVLLVLVFNEFQKNVLKGMGSTLTNLPLNVIGAFSDVVSYLRLFAVGYASVVLAQTFNGMALGGGVKGVMGGVAAAFILFLGHTLNIVLALMAVIVHGIRLNMLEFSANHMGMQWAGKEYEPFRE